MQPRVGDITALLSHWREGDPRTADKLVALVYPDLKRIAEARMRNERPDHTLQPTALVNEVFVQLLRQNRITWRDRHHFLAVAAQTMRRVLVDYARRRGAAKRGSDAPLVELEAVATGKPDRAFDLLELDEILKMLAAEDPRAAKVVELRYFAGLNFEEIAVVLNIASRTVKRDWDYARAWLYERMSGERCRGRTAGSN